MLSHSDVSESDVNDHSECSDAQHAEEHMQLTTAVVRRHYKIVSSGCSQ
jgi:hypothetical protein